MPVIRTVTEGAMMDYPSFVAILAWILWIFLIAREMNRMRSACIRAVRHHLAGVAVIDFRCQKRASILTTLGDRLNRHLGVPA